MGNICGNIDEPGRKGDQKQARKRPSCGNAIIIINSENKILAGKRVKSGLYGLPGGGVELGETIKGSAAREVIEETGIQVNPEDLKSLEVINYPTKNQHFVDWVLACKMPDDQIPKAMEPKSCDAWNFYSLEELQQIALFEPLRVSIENGKKITTITYENFDEIEDFEEE